MNSLINNAKKELGDEVSIFIEQCIKKEHPESHLISVLHKVQTVHGFLSKEKMEAVAHLMQIPTAKVSGVATFYHFFELKPKGILTISVCQGTACHVKGADAVAKRLEEELGIQFGETSKDGIFTLVSTRCLGICALAPVIKVGEEVHSHVTPDQIPGILESYRKRYEEGKLKKDE